MGGTARLLGKRSPIAAKVGGLLAPNFLKTCARGVEYSSAKLQRDLGWKPRADHETYFQGKRSLRRAGCMRRRTVLFLMESMEVAGAEQLVLLIVLDRDRFRPIIGCLTVPGPLAPEVEAAGVQLVALGKRPGFDLSILRKLIRLMREKQVDVLHTHVWPADVWGRIAGLAARVPVMITTEHNVCDWKNWKHFAIDRWLARASRWIVCVSDAVKGFYQSQAGLPASGC